jgi:hypothetical protein
MIALIRRQRYYTVHGEDARRLNREQSYTLFHSDGEPFIAIPIESLPFHLWQLLTVDDVVVDDVKHVVTVDRVDYASEFEFAMRFMRSKGWSAAAAGFEVKFNRMVQVGDGQSQPVGQLTLF